MGIFVFCQGRPEFAEIPGGAKCINAYMSFARVFRKFGPDGAGGKKTINQLISIFLKFVGYRTL